MSPVALITGGTRGIGRATVEHLVASGWQVAFTFTSSEDAARAIETQSNGAAAAFRANVRDRDAAGQIVAAVVERFERIDALVNNAGIRRDALLYNMSPEEWDDVLDTNLGGVFALTKAVLPLMMRQRSGAIVNVTSLSAFHGLPGQTNYAASKGAVVAMTRSLAREVARSGIRVNCVAPGFVETEMTASLDPEAKKELIRQIPMRRAVRAAEVADVIEFLLSARSSAITGQTIVVDGGASA